MPPEVALPTGHRDGACEGLVGEGEWKVVDAVFFAGREGPDRVIRRGFRSIEDRVDVRNLPLPDREIHRGPDLTPMVAGRMRRVDHPVVFRGCALFLEEPPDSLNRPAAIFRCHRLSAVVSFRAIEFPPPYPILVGRVEWGWADLNCRRRLFCSHEGSQSPKDRPSYPTAPDTRTNRDTR